MTKRENSKNSSFKIIQFLLATICFLSLIMVSYLVLRLNVVPTKYLWISLLIVTFICAFLLIFVLHKGKKIVKVSEAILVVCITVILGYLTCYLNSTYHFFQNSIVGKYDGISYSVIVLRTENYQTIKDLKNKKIGYVDDDTGNEVLNKLKKKIAFQGQKYTEFGWMPEDLLNQKVEAIVLEDSYYQLVKEEIEEFEEKTKIIDTFRISVRSHKEETKDINLTKEPFILYISGIDQYGKVNSVRGRSDVNQLAVINPTTHHILLVNTPRDYYVQLAGTTGLKDKLTHAGIYGINKSIETLEKLYDMNIDSYLRVNFNTLIDIVDVIGGIDIYSDKAFRTWTNKQVYIQEGWNRMDGKMALAYARERKTYITGDHHRGANQQQVITAIIEKVSNSMVLISKYNSILNTLNGTFQTDMDMKKITTFIKYQLDEMPKWKIESIAVTGYNSSNYTYSMGRGRKLYVMEPDWDSVDRAKQEIKRVMGE